MRFIPILPNDKPIGTLRVDQLCSLNGNDAHRGYVADVDFTEGSARFQFSAITCTHADGKSWQSIYIPATPSSVNGVSITWWNRKPGAKGQINVKPDSELNWYGTVQSKVISKGYNVLAYSGREIGLSPNHAYCAELFKMGVGIPQSAVSLEAFDDIASMMTSDDLGKTLGSGLVGTNPVIELLFARISASGLLFDALRDAAYQINASPVAKNVQQIMLSAFDEIYRLIDGEKTTIDSEFVTARPKKAPEHPKPKEEIYSSWGAFG